MKKIFGFMLSAEEISVKQYSIDLLLVSSKTDAASRMYIDRFCNGFGSFR
jgi:hypothetical protein